MVASGLASLKDATWKFEMAVPSVEFTAWAVAPPKAASAAILLTVLVVTVAPLASLITTNIP